MLNRKSVALGLVLLSIIQQFPVVSEIYYTQIRLILYCGFGLLTLQSLYLLRDEPIIKFEKYFLIALFFSIVLTLISGVNGNLNTSLMQIVVPVGIYLISRSMILSDKDLKSWVFWYSLLSVIMGFLILFYYGEGFVVTKNYFYSSKNQIGPLLGISSILIFNDILRGESEKLSKLIYKFIMLISLLTIIIFLRNRSGLLSVILVMVFMIFIKISKIYSLKMVTKKQIFKFFAILSLVVIIVNTSLFNDIKETFYGSLFLNYDTSSLQSLSAGRFDNYVQSLQFISENPIGGELFRLNNIVIGTPHNYVLFTAVNFGIIMSLGLIAFYFYLWKLSFKFAKVGEIAGFLLLFSLIISLTEYSYPYGPGVSQLLIWFYIGQSSILTKRQAVLV